MRSLHSWMSDIFALIVWEIAGLSFGELQVVWKFEGGREMVMYLCLVKCSSL